MSFRTRVFAAALVAAAATAIASPVAAQQRTPADSARGALPAIVSTAESEGLLGRIWNMQERRHEVIELDRENRRLAWELRRYDRRIAQLTQHLDSLKRIEAEKTRLIADLDSATAATRARRLVLEARLRAMQERAAKQGGTR